MKTELRSSQHSITGKTVIEVWHDGQFLATITGADGSGVKIISKHVVKATASPDDGSGVGVLEVRIEPAG